MNLIDESSFDLIQEKGHKILFLFATYILKLL